MLKGIVYHLSHHFGVSTRSMVLPYFRVLPLTQREGMLLTDHVISSSLKNIFPGF